MAFFTMYFEPEQDVLSFPNTEYFINKLENGNWKKYHHPNMPEEDQEKEKEEDEQEQYQDQYIGRGRASNRRGRGPGRGGQRGNYHPRGRWGRF